MSAVNSFNILIADDNVVNRRVLHDLLKMRGHSVRAVNDGLQAVEALETEAFDLVILDCLMPNMDGYEACRTIRAADPGRMNPAVPILAVTALATKADRRKCIEAGMNDYISKPIMAKTLFERVEGLLRQNGPAGGGVGGGRDDEWAARAPDSEEDDPARRAARDIFESLSTELDHDLIRWQSELRTHLERDDHDELRLLAHKIRGTADLAECRDLSELAARLERAAGMRHEADVKSLAPQVIDSLQRLRKRAHVKE